MGHHHREEPRSEPQISGENRSAHPFFESKDLTYLSLILPLLSDQGKQFINFFLKFGNPNQVTSVDPVSILKQLSTKLENSPLLEFLPAILNLISNQENKAKLNPSTVSNILSNLNPVKEGE